MDGLPPRIPGTSRRHAFLAAASIGALLAASKPAEAAYIPLAASMFSLSNIAALQANTAPLALTWVQGYRTPGDGGEGAFYLGPATTANGITIFNDAAGRSWYRQTGGQPPSIKWAGAYGDAIHDDTAAINATLAFSQNVWAPPGVYKTTGPLTLGLQEQKLLGAGRDLTVFQVNSTTATGLVVSGSEQSFAMSGFTVSRVGTPSFGANGIATGICSQSLITDVNTTGHFFGFSLGATDYSTMQNCFTLGNVSHGLFMTNAASFGALQWQLDNVLSQNNGGSGFFAQATSGPGNVTMGTWTNCATFANSSTGASFLGLPGTPINDVRIFGGFFGADGSDEIALSTYGSNNCIRDVFIELPGTGATGIGNATPASHRGNGISADSTVFDISLTGCHIVGASFNGMVLAAAENHLSGCRIWNNGVAGVSGATYGISHSAGRLSITGCRNGNTAASTFQTFGLTSSVDANSVSIVGGDWTGNVTAPYQVLNQSNIQIMGVLPNTINTIIPNGAMMVGSNLVPQAPATINVGGGLFKTGSAYVNP